MRHLLYRALRSEHGIKIKTDNPALLRAKLYAERREDPSLMRLRLFISPKDPNEVWLVKDRRAKPDAS